MNRLLAAVAVALLVWHPAPSQAHTPIQRTSQTHLSALLLAEHLDRGITRATLGLWLALQADVSASARPRSAAILGPPGAPPGEPVERWRTLVETYFPADEVATALRVMACESGGNPAAKNPTSTAAGLWQFLRSTWDWVAGELGLPTYAQGGPYDPEASTRAAAWLAAPEPGRGWQHWVCY